MVSKRSYLVLGVVALAIGLVWALTVLAHDLPLFFFTYLDVWQEWFLVFFMIDLAPTVGFLFAGCYLMYKWVKLK